MYGRFFVSLLPHICSDFLSRLSVEQHGGQVSQLAAFRPALNLEAADCCVKVHADLAAQIFGQSGVMPVAAVLNGEVAEPVPVHDADQTDHNRAGVHVSVSAGFDQVDRPGVIRPVWHVPSRAGV
ncbi:MAG: hypothetical protein COW24_01060 [Candidatus Kerfeldbacteria bacterium CG15_BIG_FIL_POST_REV_8_21_14_020_45_12]|uniref:Uncharacterized protein n=1 Tax=Candidatus Kerfeldbacteria bacterium CG15_BIG_FIL_POST_REV_8_21_14_020_45_12 TaxID=2014247 RepID=A0A2M7H4X5_9BACT|nr:MAG: hypothetical protein COW24_01060 [Candidatus Kerfeldbacteria bacterium CG15_BIG_FIL_POST_REV_8_21_14_020_45_12]